MKLSTMLEAKAKLAVETLAVPFEDDALLRDDSISSNDVMDDTVKTYDVDVAENYVLKECQKVNHGDSIVTVDDWEKILIDGVNGESNQESRKKQKIQ